ANTGSNGAQISGAGNPSLAADATDPGSVTLTGSSMFSGTSCIFLQGDALVATGAPFFAGVRCVGGSLIRLYVKTGLQPSGSMTAPVAGDLSISNRSIAQVPSQPISAGQTRYYQVYYRDPAPNPGGSCPPVNGANITNALSIVWSPSRATYRRAGNRAPVRHFLSRRCGCRRVHLTGFDDDAPAAAGRGTIPLAASPSSSASIRFEEIHEIDSRPRGPVQRHVVRRLL